MKKSFIQKLARKFGYVSVKDQSEFLSSVALDLDVRHQILERELGYLQLFVKKSENSEQITKILDSTVEGLDITHDRIINRITEL